MKKKLVACALAFVLAAGMLAGCGGGNGDGKGTADIPGSQAPQKGKYVEKEVILPETVNKEDTFMMDKEDGKLVLYTKENKDEMVAVNKYIRDEAGAWTQESMEWVSLLSIPYEKYGGFKVRKGSDGSQYLYISYTDPERDGNMLGHLYRSADGLGGEEITPEDWLVMNEKYQYYETPVDIIVLDEGTLVARFYSRTTLYDGVTGEKKQDLQSDKYYTEMIYRSGGQYLLTEASDMGNLIGIDFYTPGKDTPDKTYTAGEGVGDGGYLDVLEDGTVILANREGFFKAAPGEDTIENKIINGSDTSFTDYSMWCMDVKAIGDVYYALFNSESGRYTIMQYEYDPEAEILPAVELTLYTLYESFTLQQAAVMFHKEHPEVIIKVETGLSYEQQYMGDFDLEDMRKQLNAKLMSGEGPDILITDGLKSESLVDKGVFADLTDTVKPLQESGELLNSIVDTYYGEDGKIHIVPLKFSMDLIVGKDIDAESVRDIKSLASAVAGMESSVFGEMTPEDLVNMFAPYFLSEIVDGKQLDKEALAEYLGYLKVIGDNTGIISSYGDTGYKKGVFDLPSSISAVIKQIKGFNGAMDSLSAAKLVNGTYTSFENAFTPVLQAGVNAKSEYVDIAKQFLAFALSQKIQDSDMYDGFPINVKSLELQKGNDRSNIGGVLSLDMGDGAYQEFRIEDYEAAEAEKLAELCRSLNRSTMRDNKIEQEIIAAIPAYLSGEKTVEETITAIDDALRMYLAE